MKKKLITLAFSLAFFYPVLLFAQNSNTIPQKDWLDELSIYAKVFGAVVAALGVIFGLPLAVLNFKKTKAEIKKLELETRSLEGASTNKLISDEKSSVINISDSPNSNIQVLSDPRFLGPLLLLLDFIIAWILISFADYLMNLFFDSKLNLLVSFLIASILYLPILRESWGVRKKLKAKK